MVFDFADVPPTIRYKLLVSTVAPRPIAWIVSQGKNGALNAAPFSFFNVFSGDPPVVGIGISHRTGDLAKDTYANIKATREFVVNLVSEQTAAAMNVTAIEFGSEVDELAQAGLTTRPSVRVKPPRIGESPVSLECALMQIVEISPNSGIVLGTVLALHVRDEAVLDAASGRVDTPALKLIGRMQGAGWYARTSDLFEMPRIPLNDWTRTETHR